MVEQGPNGALPNEAFADSALVGERIALTMLVVQPVELHGCLLDAAMAGAVDLDSAALRSPPQISPIGRPGWATSWSDWAAAPGFAGRFLTAFRVLHWEGPQRIAQLRVDIGQHYSGPQPAMVADTLRWIESRLVLDVRLNFFVAIHELTFMFDDEASLSTLLADAEIEPECQDFYNGLRLLFVAEHGDAPGSSTNGCSSYVNAVNDTIRKRIIEVAAAGLDIQARMNEVVIPPSTGNISFIALAAPGSKISGDLKTLLQVANSDAELVSKKTRRLDLAEDELCIFGARFHSIVASSSLRRKRFMLMQFHLQFFWFYIHQLQGAIERVQTSLATRRSTRETRDISSLAGALILRAQLLTSHRDALRTHLGADADGVYRLVQDQWSIDQGIQQLGHATAFLRDYFAQREAKLRIKASDRIGGLLLFISLLQLFGLISFWHDYLSLLSSDFTVQSPVADWLGGEANLKQLNLIFPALIAVIALVGLLLAYLRFRREP